MFFYIINVLLTSFIWSNESFFITLCPQRYIIMLKLMLLTLGIVGFSMLFLCIRMILIPKGRFRSLHIGQSPAMRKRGIHCVQSMDRMMRKENPHKVQERV